MSRYHLHVTKQEDFTRWARGQGYTLVDTRAEYETFRLSPPDGSGELPFYLRLKAQHVTAPRGPQEELVKRWLRERSQPKARSSSSPSPGGSTTCDDPSTTSPPWN